MVVIVTVILIVCILAYVAATLLIYACQRKLIYHPTKHVSVEGLDEEDVIATGSGHRLKSYTANPGKPHVLLYFGGNAESIAPRIKELSEHLPDITIIGVDYRGYGGSEGQPSERAFYDDALSQYDLIAQRFDKVSTLGRSLGSAVAVYLSTQREIDNLILVTPFDSLVSIASARYWCFPIRWLMKDKFDSVAMAGDVTSSTLILTAETDSIVPEGNTARLLAALISCPRTLFRINGTGHNTIGSSPSYACHILEFVEQRRPSLTERNA